MSTATFEFTDAPEDIVPDHTASAPPRPTKRTWPGGGKRQQQHDSPLKAVTPEVPKLPRGFAGSLAEVYVTLGAFWSPFDPVCGQAIIDAAPKCAESLVKLAETNAAVRSVLLKLTTTSAIGAVITAHFPILMTVYMHHKAMPKAVAEPPPTPGTERFTDAPAGQRGPDGGVYTAAPPKVDVRASS